MSFSYPNRCAHEIFSGTSGSFGVPAGNDDKHTTPSVEKLDAYALERWEVSFRIYGLLCLNGCLDNTSLHGILRIGPLSC